MKRKTTSNKKFRLFPVRGEVFLAVLDPTVGREMQKTRPAVVVSNNQLNELTDMVVVLPITSGQRRYVNTINIDPPEGGLRKKSRIVIEQIRSIDKTRLGRKLGNIGLLTMFSVEDSLRDLLGLPEGHILP